jgi:uncharacterized protein YciI
MKKGNLMKTRISRMALILVVFTGLLAAQTPEPNPLTVYVPKNMKPYYLDLLLKGEKHEAEMSDAARLQMMQKHLAYVRSQGEAGKFLLVGPLTEENRLRGIAVIRAESPEEAGRIAAGDPAVQDGHMGAELRPILLEDLSSIRFEYPAGNQSSAKLTAVHCETQRAAEVQPGSGLSVKIRGNPSRTPTK